MDGLTIYLAWTCPLPSGGLAWTRIPMNAAAVREPQADFEAHLNTLRQAAAHTLHWQGCDSVLAEQAVQKAPLQVTSDNVVIGEFVYAASV